MFSIKKRRIVKIETKTIFVLIFLCGHRKLTADYLRGVFAKPCHNGGVKALNAVVALVACQRFAGFTAKLIIALAGLKLHDKGASALDGFQHGGEKENGLLASAELHFLKL